MCKKLLIVGAIVLVGIIAAKKMDLDDYAGCFVEKIRNRVRSQIPVETKLARLDRLINGMDKSIEAKATKMAELKWDMKELNGKISDLNDDVKVKKATLKTWIKTYDSGTEPVSFDGRTFTRPYMKTKIGYAYKECKHLESTLKTKRQILEKMDEQFELVKTQYHSLKNKKNTFAKRLNDLRTEHERIRTTDLAQRRPRENGRARRINEALRQLEKEFYIKTQTRKILNKSVFRKSAKAEPKTETTNFSEIREYANGATALHSVAATKKD